MVQKRCAVASFDYSAAKCSINLLRRFEEFFERDLNLFQDVHERRSLDRAVSRNDLWRKAAGSNP
jgi:hypothetical protein